MSMDIFNSGVDENSTPDIMFDNTQVAPKPGQGGLNANNDWAASSGPRKKVGIDQTNQKCRCYISCDMQTDRHVI